MSSTDDRGCIRAGEESPGFTGPVSYTHLDVYKRQHIWLGRVRAIINPKEMVEVRHEINTRRYKLRQQIEYNEKRIDEAKENIKKITLSNPAHSDGAMRVIEMYEKRHSRVAK